MADLRLEHIYKVYPNGTKAVNDFNLDVKDKEFIVFVGPSGCGKSTTLRMIAGLEDITAGELYIGDVRVNDMEPKDRDIAMVFQNYALYPHMTVYENMAFGLELRHVPRDEIHRRVMAAAKILGLSDYLDRKPKAMSGGQRQRVSLGRAILRNPKVMLLDEPLSNLDAKLRSQMRSEISTLHQKLQTTFIYVTHDQVEAMTLGTRVVVMKLGVIQQVDAPKNLYNFPINKFVAGFIGTPQMNFFGVTLLKDSDTIKIAFSDAPKTALVAKAEDLIKVQGQYFDGKKPVVLGIRCEDISCEEEDVKKGDNLIDVVVSHFEELGNETLIYGDIGEVGEQIAASKTGVIIKASSDHGFKPGDTIKARVNIKKAHFFDGKTEKTILPRIPSDNIFSVKIANGKITAGTMSLPCPKAIQLTDFTGTMSIPTEGIHLGGKDVEATVFESEQVGEQYLIYLKSGDQLFFALNKEDLKKGTKAQVGFDYEKMSFAKDEASALAPLEGSDKMLASFVNFKTAYGVSQDQAMEDYRKKRIADAEANYQAKSEALAKAFEAEKAAIPSESALNEKKAEYAKKEAEEKTVYEANLKKIKAEFRQGKAEEKAKHKAKVKAIKAAVKKEYGDMLAKEKEDMRLAISTNRDRDAIRARKATYETFRESLPAAQQNDLDNRLNAEGFDYEGQVSSLSAAYSKNKYDLKNSWKQFQDEKNAAINPSAALEKKHKEDLSKLEAEHKNALLHANLVFFFNFNGFYALLPDPIVEKIIQGLGSKVFTKTFRIEIPHDAYALSNDGKGVKAKVGSLIDYGSRRFYACEAQDSSGTITLYVEDKKGMESGKEVSLVIDIAKCAIYETGLNMRLY